MGIGGRLKEERERLGYSQTDFAALAGASKKSQIRWEHDESYPDAAALAALAAAGADVQYVITGQRLGQPSADAPETSIDAKLMARIFDMLDRLARGAGKRWTERARLDCAVRVYNFLVKEEAPVTDERIERVLRLVVNG